MGFLLNASAPYDATSMLLQTLKAGHRTPEAVRVYLLGTEFNTATYGRMRFNDFGGIGSSPFVIR